MITSLLRQNDVATSFWYSNDVIITSCARWVEVLKAVKLTPCNASVNHMVVGVMTFSFFPAIVVTCYKLNYSQTTKSIFAFSLIFRIWKGIKSFPVEDKWLFFIINTMAAVGLATQYDDVIKWKHFPRCWQFVRGIHRSPVNSPHKGQWRRTWCFFDLRLNKRLSKQS